MGSCASITSTKSAAVCVPAKPQYSPVQDEPVSGADGTTLDNTYEATDAVPHVPNGLQSRKLVDSVDSVSAPSRGCESSRLEKLEKPEQHRSGPLPALSRPNQSSLKAPSGRSKIPDRSRNYDPDPDEVRTFVRQMSNSKSKTSQAGRLSIVHKSLDQQTKRRAKSQLASQLDDDTDPCSVSDSARLNSTKGEIPQLSTPLADSSVKYLPRGGTYVHTSSGAIQYGIPPETIKDVMTLGLDLPKYYIIPRDRFDLHCGLNVAEFEFPAYFNFFIQRRKIVLICDPDVEPLIRQVFTETLLGPQTVNLPDEYSDDVPKEAYPDLMKEMAYFRKNPFDPKEELAVDTLLSFHHFDNDTATISSDNGKEIQIVLKSDEFEVYEAGKLISAASTEIQLRNPAELERETEFASIDGCIESNAGIADSEYFTPPFFGITMLGNSDGFDKNGSTTGFVLWLNQRGIMVDPPPYSGALLKRAGINPRLICGMIVTHCHADHDAGAFQKILEELMITVYTTEVIMDSFLRKYSAISGFPTGFLKQLFHFRPVIVGEPVDVFGGVLKFFYSLHSIPCVGFQAHHCDKSMIYSADTLNDPDKLREICAAGFMSPERRDKLINFPWTKHTVILHEAGVPPIHTPLSTFAPLPDHVKEKLYIVHKSPGSLPVETGLRPALVGPENTIIISTEKPPNFDAMEILELMGKTEVFRTLPIIRATELVHCADVEYFSKGEDLIVEGSSGTCLYLIALGNVEVLVGPNQKRVKVFSTGDHVGEKSLTTDKPEKRSATIRAMSDVKVLVLRKSAFRFLIRGTNTIDRLRQLGNMQMTESWQIINANSVLEKLTPTQKTIMQTILVPKKVTKGEILWKKSEAANAAVLMDKGKMVFDITPKLQPFLRGALIGEFKAMLFDTLNTTTLIAVEDCEIYCISKQKMVRYLTDNPGLLLRLMPLLFVE